MKVVYIHRKEIKTADKCVVVDIYPKPKPSLKMIHYALTQHPGFTA